MDPAAGARWLIDATPDFGDQLRCLDELWPVDAPPPGLTGVLLTHGHMGHVAGLLQLGTEAIGARAVSVWAMPRLARNLNDAALFGRLVRDHHIVLRALAGTTPLRLSGRVSALPLVVPHRDEVGEVVAYRISGPSRSALLLPDIDDWRDLTPSIEQLIADVDVAYLDGTFYEATELGRGRQAAVPHPTILHTMDRLGSLPADVRSRVRFIHLNHTNPAIDPDGSAAEAIRAGGFDLAAQGEVVLL